VIILLLKFSAIGSLSLRRTALWDREFAVFPAPGLHHRASPHIKLDLRLAAHYLSPTALALIGRRCDLLRATEALRDA
jgi:hypothetical protein